MDAKTINFLLTFGLPLFLIFLMSFFMLRGGRARQQEAANAYKREMEIQEENSRTMKEILKSLKKIEKSCSGKERE